MILLFITNTKKFIFIFNGIEIKMDGFNGTINGRYYYLLQNEAIYDL